MEKLLACDTYRQPPLVQPIKAGKNSPIYKHYKHPICWLFSSPGSSFTP
jgi:hypothetical protein